MPEPIGIQRQGLFNYEYKRPPEKQSPVSNELTDFGTRLLNGITTFGGSYVGDAISSVSPKAADFVEKYTGGFIPRTSKEQLEANRSNNSNKWGNRLNQTTWAVGSVVAERAAPAILTAISNKLPVKGIPKKFKNEQA
jgi:hypothetical protein